jgi:hypothetical protein
MEKDNYKKYDKRMFLNRARGFVCNDLFGDVLDGLPLTEEVQDFEENFQEVPKKLTNADIIKNKAAEIIKHENIPIHDANGVIEEHNICNADSLYERDEEATENISDSSMNSELIALVAEAKQPDAQINKWLERANVTSLNDVTEPYLSAWINHLKNKLNKVE